MYPKVDFFVGLGLVVFSTVGHFMAGRLRDAEKGLGAGDWPKMILTVLFVLGVMLAGYAVYQYRKQQQSAGPGTYEKGELKNVLLLTLCVAIYIRLVATLGFILLTPFFLFALMRIFGLRQWLKMGLISVVSTAIIYVIFRHYLLVLLPRFILF